MSIKQYPLLTATLAFLGIAFLAGAGLAGWQWVEHTRSEKALQKGKSGLTQLLSLEVAPSEANVAEARKNLAEIESLEKELFDSLKGKKQFPVVPGIEGTDLVNKLRESADKLTTSALKSGTRIYRPNNFGFGFHRYVSAKDSNTPSSRLPELALEKDIIEFLVGELIAAKDGAKNPLMLLAVAREPLEFSGDRKGSAAKNSDDEYTPLPRETLRRDGIAATYYFRLKFVSRTDVLRRFVNRVRASNYPITLRGVGVAPVKPEALSELLALPLSPAGAPAAPGPEPFPSSAPAAPSVSLPGFGGDTASPVSAADPAPVSGVVVKDDPSEFTVSFEYIIPVPIPVPPPAPAPAPAKPANN